MIIRETEHEFFMIAQHDHAQLSGDIARHLIKTFFVEDTYESDVIMSIYEHDRGWIRLDETPIWNDRKSAPFSFTDYPLLPKLMLYQVGVDEVESNNAYAALLCSMYYSSFQDIRNSDEQGCVDFLSHEEARQARIRSKLEPINEEIINVHFKMLQLCDAISLYVCFNQPGIDKEHEHPWFKNGFANSEAFNVENNRQLVAEWLNEQEIKLNPSPFEQPFSATLRLKCVSKQAIKQEGINEAYKQSEWIEQNVFFN
ncbi:hypothetical protein D3C73_693910 [compost metagenome]